MANGLAQSALWAAECHASRAHGSGHGPCQGQPRAMPRGSHGPCQGRPTAVSPDEIAIFTKSLGPKLIKHDLKLVGFVKLGLTSSAFRVARAGPPPLA